MRYWSGSTWTPWIVIDGEVVVNPTRARRRLDSGDVPHLAFIDEVFIPAAHAEGAIDRATADDLSALVARLTDEAHQAVLTAEMAATTTAPARPEQVPEWATADESDAGIEIVGARYEPVVREPGPLRAWWARSRHSIGADLAVHGLAYLGVLLLFVGAFGLVAFAFGGVEPTWRPVAEVAIATAPFLTAGLLLRRGAVIVGRSLELAGGLLLPVMLMTAALDDVPPDLDGVAMVVVMTLALLAVSAGYAAWTRRHADSALRFVVAPIVWLAAGVATMGLDRELPAGAAVASLTAAQVAAISVAFAATVVLARLRPDDRLASATLTSALPGTVVVAVMAALTWLAESAPPVPVLLTGIAGLVALDRLDGRASPRAVAVAQPLWWAVVSAALLTSLEPGPAGVIAAIGFGLLLEWELRRGAEVMPLVLCSAGAVVGFGVTIAQPWFGVGVASLGTVWLGWRRVRPGATAVPGLLAVLDGAASAVPLAALVWLGLATDSLVIPAGVGSLVVLLASIVARRGLARRDASDRFWSIAWAGSAVAVTLSLALAWDTSSAPEALGWWMPASAAVLTGACVVGPMPAVARPWAVAGFATFTWALTGEAAGVSLALQGVVVAAVGLAVVVVAHVAPGGWIATTVAGSLGMVGHVLGLGALLFVGAGAALAVGTGAATAGFAVTTVADTRGRSPVGGLLSSTHPVARYLAPLLAAVGVPVTAAATMDAAGVAWSDTWPLTVLLAATALGYGALTRLVRSDVVRRTAAGVASGAAVLVPWTASDRPTALAGLCALVATVWVLPAALRAAPLVWLAWAALAPLAALVAESVSPAVADLPAVDVAALALVGVGAVLTVAGLSIDRARADDARAPWRLRPWGLVPVVVTGVAELGLVLMLAVVAVAAPLSGWLMLGVAATVLIVGVLRRAGVLGGVAAALAWAAVLALEAPVALDRAWVSLLVGSGLLVLADVARRLSARPWWARWDVSLFVAAHLVVATAVLSVPEAANRALVVAAVGLLSLGVAARLVSTPKTASVYAAIGVVLVLIGAVDAGPGWTSLVLLLMAAGCVGGALARGGTQQRVLQVGGAVAAVLSWQQAAVWWGLAAQSAVDVTAVGVGVLALVAALGIAWRPTLQSWSATWGGVSTLVGAGLALAVLAEIGVGVSWATVTGAGLIALAVVVAAEVVDAAGLRFASMGLLALSGLEVLALLDASPSMQVVSLAGTGAVAAVATLAPVVAPRLAPWQRPLLALGVGSAVAATAVAVGEWPDRLLLVPTLMAGTVVAAAAGVVLSSVWLRVLAAMLACGAWVMFAAEAMGDNPQWYTVPMGVALLAAVGLLRQDARRRGADPASRSIVTLEVVGITFIVGASFVQAVTDSLAYVALALVLGIALGVWGLLTKVRRRVVAAGVVVLASALLLVAVPLVSLLPSWQGTALWIFLAGAGLVAILVATAIEKGRTIVHRALDRYVALGDEWE